MENFKHRSFLKTCYFVRWRRRFGQEFVHGYINIYFFVSLILTGAVFGGKKYLSSQLEKDKATFVKTQEAFDTLTIDTLVKLDKRIESAKKY